MTNNRSHTSTSNSAATVHDWVFHSPGSGINQAALVSDSTGAEITGTTIKKNSQRVASALLSRNLEPGAGVAVALPNMPVVAEIALGTIISGCTLAMLNPALPVNVFAQKLKEVDAKILITMAGSPSAEPSDGSYETILVGGIAGNSYENFIAESVITEFPIVKPNTVAMIFQSSGTTSPSKPIEMTHAGVVCGLETIDNRLKLNNNDAALAIAPFFHVIGFYVLLLNSLRRGVKVVTVEKFVPEKMPEQIDRHKVSILCGNPPMMRALARVNSVKRFPSLRIVYSGGAPLDYRTETELTNAYPDALVGQAYGLTEFMPLSMTELGDRHPIGTVGRAVDGTELKIIDPDSGSERLIGKSGEVVVRGPQTMRSYRGFPKETSEMIDANGWLHTADLGHLDDRGFLFLTGRLKEMITVHGRRFAPKTYEDLILQLDSVREVVVAGAGEDPNNQIPIAFVVGDKSLTTNQVQSVFEDRPEFPHCEVVFVDAIPKSPAGKILRIELLKQLDGSLPVAK